MRFRDDNRGVTVQIGAVLLFATLIMALAVYQATVVPAQNADIEYKHSQEVQSDLVDVRNSLLTAAASGSSQPVSVDLGMNYPSRVFLMNPSPPAGTLETGSYADSSIRLSNVQATDDETRDYIDGSWSASTKFLAYEPDYNEYRGAPTLLYEASILSNYYPDVDNGTAVPLTGQVLVDNETRTISLVSLNGTLSTSQSGAASVSPEALSAPSRRVQVEPANTGAPVELSVPTKVSAAVLRNSTSLGDHPGVVDVTDHPTDDDRVVVTVEWDEPFTLQTAMVGVGSDTTNPGPHYVTVAEHRDGYVTLEVRDRFNNPETGVPVSVASGGSVLEDASTKRTGTEGQVTFGAADGESGTVEFEIEDGSEAREVASVSLSDAAAGGGNGSGGPYTVTWDTAAIGSQTGVEYHAGNDTVVIDVGTPGTPDPAAFVADVANESGSAVAGVGVDYATTNQTVVQFSPSASDTDGSGESTTDATYDLGRATVYAEAGGDSDALGVKVIDSSGGGGAPPTPQLDVRVDDLTRQNGNTPVYIASYDVSNTNSSFERVEVTFRNLDNDAATGTQTSSTTRAGLRYSNGYGAGADYEIVYEVVYTDSNGDEYVAVTETVADVSDAQNPSGNADLGTSSTASFTSWSIRDQTQTNNNQPRYRFSYSVTSTGSFSEVRAYALNIPGSGASGVRTFTSRSQNNQDIQFNFGANSEYRVGLLVRDANGTVVDVVNIRDVADGNGQYSGP